jgi:biopolymer transport protein ExbD
MSRFRFDAAGLGFELPITPMLDFTFQLLFFFMMYYNPSALEGQIEIALPHAREPAAHANTPPPLPVEGGLNLPADLTIYLGARLDAGNYGRISFITVKNRNGEETFSSIEAFKPYLANIRETLQNKEDVKIDADSRIMLAEYIKIVDACKNVGFKIGVGQAATGGAP